MDSSECKFCGAPRSLERTVCQFCNRPYPPLAAEAAPAAVASQNPWEPGWRWCSKCQCLFFQVQGGGSCAAGADHDSTGSESYALTWDAAATGEAGWAWCSKCGVLFYKGNSGCCAAGGDHDGEGSPDYRMNHEPTADNAVSGYKWCHACGAMFYAGEADGACAAATAHDRGNDNVYNVFLEADQGPVGYVAT